MSLKDDIYDIDSALRDGKARGAYVQRAGEAFNRLRARLEAAEKVADDMRRYAGAGNVGRESILEWADRLSPPDQQQPKTEEVMPSDRCGVSAGKESLWAWFGLSRASWLTMPRVMMHAMPDGWQARMAELCHEWDAHWQNQPDLTPHVTLKSGGKFVKIPGWLLNYRHPDQAAIARIAGTQHQSSPVATTGVRSDE